MIEWIATNCESVGNTHDICQDHTEYMVSNNVHVGALADGVSSNKYSDEGARAVTRITCQEICENFKKYCSGELSSKNFVQRVQAEMHRKYADEYKLNQMKSTLLFCAIYKNSYIIGHIGDGAVLCFGRESCVISPPQENEVGGTATYTILDYNADEHFRIKIGSIEELDGFLITSDGLLGNVYYSGTDIPQLAYELFGSVYKKNSPLEKGERDAQFKAYLAEHIQHGNDLADDCSLFMIARKKRTGYVDYDALNGFEADVKWPCKCGNANRMDEIRCSNCRTMYTALYPATIIRINSKESFFSKLNKWMVADSEDIFNPGATAEVIDPNNFTSVCQTLKIAAADKGVSIVDNADHSSDNVPKTDNVSNKMTKKTNKVQPRKIDVSGTAIERMAQLGINTIKKGLQLILETDSTYPKQQSASMTESDRASIRKVFPITLTHEQLDEIAYQLGYLPMPFGSTDESIDINDERKNVVKAMFCRESFFDFFYNDETGSNVIHYYRLKNRTIAVYDDRTSDFCCTESNDAQKLFKRMLIPGNRFSNELQQCNKLNLLRIEYQKKVLSWTWESAYIYCKANAAKMLRIFESILAKSGYQLDKVIANAWFVAGNKSSTEIVAYLLTNRYLIRLKSVDREHVKVDQVDLDDSCALQLKEKYLVSQL